MKKIGLLMGLGVVIMIIVAIMTAGQMGETSHAIARGTVVLDDAVREQSQGIDTLFIIALGQDRPMPLGAFKKHVSGPLSGAVYEFVLTKDNMQLMGGTMGEGEAFPEEFKLKARLDRDGVAGPDQPGDVVGEIALVKRGQGGLELRLDRVVQ